MIIADIVIVSILFSMLWYNIGHNVAIYDKIVAEHHDIFDHLSGSLSLFLVNIDAIGVCLYLVKSFMGMRYLYVSIFPPKKDYEFLYNGKLGHHNWRVQRVKRARKKLFYYLIFSCVASIFIFVNDLIIEGCFQVLGQSDDLKYRLIRLSFVCCIAIYQIWYALRKIVAHLKELDGLVTSRFHDSIKIKERLRRRKQKKLMEMRRK